MKSVFIGAVASLTLGLCANASAQKTNARSFDEIGPYGSGFSRAKQAGSEFDLKIGGHIKLDGIYDSQQIDSDLPFFALPDRVAVTNPDGTTTLTTNPKAETHSFNLAARELLLNVSVATPDYGDWAASAYIEFNFLGFLEGANAGSPTPILRHGYVTLANKTTNTRILFGQAQGPFAPKDPQTVNWETYVLMGDVFTRLPQLRLEQGFGDFTAAIAAVRPADYLNDSKRGFDIQGRGQDSGLPEGQARITYALPTTGHYWFFKSQGEVGLSGRFARERFNAATDAEKDVSSWTLAADFLIPIGPLTLSGEVYYGQNTDNVYGLAGVTGSSATGQFIPDEMVAELGGWTQLGWNISDRVYVSAIFGIILPDQDAIETKEIDNGLGIKRNMAITGNAYYRILPTLFVAAEYTRLDTQYWAAQDIDGTLHRVQTSLLFSF